MPIQARAREASQPMTTRLSVAPPNSRGAQPIQHRGAFLPKSLNSAGGARRITLTRFDTSACRAQAQGHPCVRTYAACVVQGIKGMGKLTGGCVLRKRPQLILANHLCCLTSEAPLLLPRRVHSRLSRRRVMMSLPALRVRVRQRNREITEVLVAQQTTELGGNVLTVTPWACPGNERVGSIYCGTCRCARHP